MHEESGFDYPFPDLKAKDFEEARVLVDEDGAIVDVVAARKTAEIYLWANPRWRNPRWRLDSIIEIHEDMRQRLEAKGYGEAHAVLPPEVERSFGRRLQRIFHWSPSRWRLYSRPVKEQS